MLVKKKKKRFRKKQKEKKEYLSSVIYKMMGAYHVWTLE